MDLKLSGEKEVLGGHTLNKTRDTVFQPPILGGHPRLLSWAEDLGCGTETVSTQPASMLGVQRQG